MLRVDTAVGPGSNPDASTGRFSVRLESKKTYNGGLFIFDVKHTPYACGAWPALWLTDPSNWPDHGEIDIMEAINQGAAGNAMTLHTTGGCSMGVKRKQTGETDQENCDHGANNNAGCAVKESPSTFGTKLNDAGGTVMAVEWRSAGIRMWQFARSAVPSDITGKKPNPSTWGTAAADFPSTDCDIGSHFKNNSIIVNIDLCGDLVYGSWDKSGCQWSLLLFQPLKNTVKLMNRISRLWYLQGSRCQSARLIQDGVLGVWLVRSVPVDVSPFFDATCKGDEGAIKGRRCGDLRFIYSGNK